METIQIKKTVKTAAKLNTPKGLKPKETSKKKPVKNLSNLFEDSLRDIFWAEKVLTRTLSNMAGHATSPDLKLAIEIHLKETNEHISRLEEIFKILQKKAIGKKCSSMEGLIKEGQGIMEETEIGAVRDAGIIAASQKIEHYEITTYGTLYAFATALDQDDIARLLLLTLEEEKKADVKLTEIALAHINIDATERK